MKWSDEMLQQRVQAQTFTPIYATTYDQLKDYYQGVEGQRGWIGALAQALSGSANRSRSNKEYAAARRAVERYEKGQHKSLSKKYSDQFKTIGRKLPPVGYRPPKKIKITFQGRVQVSGGRRKKDSRTGRYTGALRGDGWVKASFTRELSGQDVINPTFNALFGAYFQPGFEENPVTDFDVASIAVARA